MSLYFTGEHEWIKVEGDTATIGISDHAQHALGDIVFAEVPEQGRSLNKGDEAAVVESVKAASDVYAPIAGDVIMGNPALADDPVADQPRPRGRGLVLQDDARRQGRARRPDGRSRLPRMGRHALTNPPASTSQWDAGDYARVGGFVPALGAAALALLDPQPGEAILDVGCGDGSLTQQILEARRDRGRDRQ